METVSGFSCSFCPAFLKTLGAHAHHQKLHSNDSNFSFECGSPNCILDFSTFGALTSHISKCHKLERKIPSGRNVAAIVCPQCSHSVSSIVGLVRHLQEEHLAKGTSIMCPFTDCGRNTPLQSKSVFSKHLSQQHQNWREMPQTALIRPTSSSSNFEDDGTGDCGGDGGGTEEAADEGSEEEAESYFSHTEEDIFEFIAKFYLMMETVTLVPVTVIDKISKNLVFLSEMVQCHMNNRLTSELKSEGLPQHKIDRIVCNVADANLLFVSHQKNLRGPTFTTDHLRRKYYKERFECMRLKLLDLSIDPLDPAPYAYKSIGETLTKLLLDPTIQKEIAESFKRFEKSSEDTVGRHIYRDYTDGSVMKKRCLCLPAKRIDLIMMQDGFSATAMLTTVRSKHKTLGMYSTLGNLSPRLRTKLKAMHLVMLILEEHVKNYRQECFAKLVKELLYLETNGIMFMGEYVPVCLQFFVGDNLGSHFLGGFVESFTAKYSCRFCVITRKDYKEDPTRLAPERTHESYRNSAQIATLRGLNNHKGVKENAELNKLQNFKVCDPGLPPCLGHDLFHGVVDWDLAMMIDNFVEKGWFTYEVLNRRIASFKYCAADSRNKPAPVKGDGKKLGGSAVQNWTLLRLLPFIIEGLFDPDDEVWKLYLKLKSISELVCAPEISDEQVDRLDLLIETYLRERSILPGDPRPKHHYLRHYAWQIRKFGPLIHLWAMRFEQMHQFFKKVSRRCNNFINLIETMSSKYQMLFAYESTGARFPETVNCKSQPLTTAEQSAELSAFLETENLPGTAQVTNRIEINGLEYKAGEWLVLSQLLTDCEVGQIESIVLHTGKIFLVIRKQMAQLKENCGLYVIDDEIPGDLFMLDWSTLTKPRTQGVYMFDYNPHFSLKHSFPLD